MAGFNRHVTISAAGRRSEDVVLPEEIVAAAFTEQQRIATLTFCHGLMQRMSVTLEEALHKAHESITHHINGGGWQTTNEEDPYLILAAEFDVDEMQGKIKEATSRSPT